MYVRSFMTGCAMLALASVAALGQSRDFQAERLIVDDNNGNTIVLQTPAGPITGGTLTIPDPQGTGSFLISNPPGGSQTVSGDLLPGIDSTYDLGSVALPWQDLFLSGVISAGGLDLDFTSGSVLFADGSGNLAQNNSNFFWDNINTRLGIGTNVLDDALDVVGDIHATGTLQSGASIVIDGTTPGSHNISTTGAEDLTIAPGGGDLAVTGNVNATGNADVDGNLNVDGNSVTVGTSDLQGAVSNSTGDVVIADDANVTGSLDIDTDLNVDGNAVVVGTSDLQGAVSNSTGDVVIADDANVTGSLDVDTDLNVDGNAVVVGTSDLQGAVSSSTGDVVISDNANVTGNADVDGTLNADGATTLNDAVALGDAAADAVTLNGTLTGAGSGHSLGTLATDATVLTINGDDNTATNELDVQGDANVSGALTVGTLNMSFTQGSVVFADATGNLAEDNSNFFWDDATNRLGIGTNVLDDALDVVGDIHATGTLQSGASIVIDGTTPGSHNISTTGAEDLTITPGGGDLVVTGNVNATGNADVDGNLNVDGNSVTVGTSDLQGAVSSSTGDVTISDNVVVTGTSDLQGQVGSTTGDLQLADNVDVTGDLDVGSGNFTVAAATGNTDVGGTLNVDGISTLGGGTAVTNSRLVVDDGHWTSQQTTAPSAASAGANVTSATLGSETDVAGSIDITSSATPGAGAQATVTFNAAYNTAPIVHLTAVNGQGAGIGAYVTSTTTGFTVNFIGVPAASTSYQFNYLVIETQ